MVSSRTATQVTVNRRRMPAPHKIAEYWCSPEGIERLRRVGGDGISFVVDLGEASCFACHWFRPTEFDGVDIVKAWTLSRTGLQRCHLVPHDKGGTDEPDNLLLLCPACHFGAPDTLDPDVMLRWAVGYESWLERLIARVEREARRAGLDPADQGWLDLVPGAVEQVRREAVSSPGRWRLAAVFGIVAKRYERSRTERGAGR
jgi:HNH endonuclease